MLEAPAKEWILLLRVMSLMVLFSGYHSVSLLRYSGQIVLSEPRPEQRSLQMCPAEGRHLDLKAWDQRKRQAA